VIILNTMEMLTMTQIYLQLRAAINGMMLAQSPVPNPGGSPLPII